MNKKMLLIGALGLLACNDDDETPLTLDAGVLDATVTIPDAAAVDAYVPPPAPPPDCFMNPKTYNELINACTDAEKVDKKPSLPLLLPDGKLPPLP